MSAPKLAGTALAGAAALGGATTLAAALLLCGPAGLAFGDQLRPDVPAADRGLDVCASLDLLLLTLNLSIVLGSGQCPELTASPAAVVTPPTAGPGLPPSPAELPRHAPPGPPGPRAHVASPAHVGPPARGPHIGSPARTSSAGHTSKRPSQPSAAQVTPAARVAPAQQIVPAPPPRAAAPALPVAAPAATAPAPAAPAPAAPAPAPAPAPAAPATSPAPAPAPGGTSALEPGPVQTWSGYSATVPFDRALRIPLQTPRLSTQQAALVIGIAVTGAALVSVGVPGRRDGE
ncbi:MAG TPA: hypothetical protein VGG16_00420 [Streptosporangiaceae bacterium]